LVRGVAAVVVIIVVARRMVVRRALKEEEEDIVVWVRWCGGNRDSLDDGVDFRSWLFLSVWMMSMSSGGCRCFRIRVNGRVESM